MFAAETPSSTADSSGEQAEFADLSVMNHIADKNEQAHHIPVSGHQDKIIKGGAPKQIDVPKDAPIERRALLTFHRSDFQVGGMIGQGSFATVHKAKHVASGKNVALKVVRPESELDFGRGPNGSTPAVCYRDVLRAMKKEVAIMESMGINDHVVEILGVAEECRVFVMERAVSDLYTIVKQQDTRLPLGHAKLWADHMVSAIDYIHSMGVVHQDIKSSNVLVFPNRVAKLCDFGLAKQWPRLHENMPVDRELITLWYRAPEIIMGDDTYSPKVDEWGIGCVLLEMMIGMPPFKGKPECSCSCSQITHRNFNSDQLMKIFLCIGTPDKPSTQACAAHFNRWPHFPRKLESTIQRVITAERVSTRGNARASSKDVAQAVEEWTEVISSMLQLDPNSRLTARDILNKPLFNSGKASSPTSSAMSEMNTPTASPCVSRTTSSDSQSSHSHGVGEGDGVIVRVPSTNVTGSPAEFSRRCSAPTAVIHQRLTPDDSPEAKDRLASRAAGARPHNIFKKSTRERRRSFENESVAALNRDDQKSRAAAIATRSSKSQSMDAGKLLHINTKLLDGSSGDDGKPRDPVTPPKSGNILTSIKRRVDSLLRTGSAVTTPSNAAHVVLPAVGAAIVHHHKETAGDVLRRKSLEHAHAGYVVSRGKEGLVRPAPGAIKFSEGTREARRINSPVMHPSSRRSSVSGPKTEKHAFVRRGSADSAATGKHPTHYAGTFTRSKSDGCDRSSSG